jgi:hypothetical protein
MSLFVCDKCGCVENTALSGFWWRPKGAPALCSACDPQFGRWHGRFKRQLWNGLEEVNNREYYAIPTKSENITKLTEQATYTTAKKTFTVGEYINIPDDVTLAEYIANLPNDEDEEPAQN